MAVVSVSKLFTGHGGTDTFSRQRTYREVYEVVTDDPTDNEAVVSAPGTGIPRLGSPHPNYAYAVCVEFDANQSEETPYIWQVALKYDSKFDLPNSTSPDGASQTPGDVPENPLLRPVIWKTIAVKTTEPARKWRKLNSDGTLAATFTPVSNSAKLPFDPPATIEVCRPGIRIVKNVASVSLGFTQSLEGAINSADWRGVPKWCARIDNVEAGNKYENGISYVELSFEILFKGETWLLEALDCGFYELTNRTQSDGTQKATWTKLRDPFGHEASEPQPLDGTGRRLAPNATPVYLRGLPSNYQLADFASLLGL